MPNIAIVIPLLSKNLFIYGLKALVNIVVDR